MNYKAVWKPLPGSQSLSLSCPCNEILYEGTRGPGKTAAQLARFRRLVGLGYGSFWRCQQRVKSDPLTATTNGLILIHLVYSGLASAITPAFRFCFSR